MARPFIRRSRGDLNLPGLNQRPIHRPFNEPNFNPMADLLPSISVPDALPSRDGKRLPPILSLPTELDEMIFHQLEKVDRACLASTCRAANRLIGCLFKPKQAVPGPRFAADNLLSFVTPRFPALTYPNVPEFLNRLDDGNPYKWLCVKCAAWHVFDARKIGPSWLEKLKENSHEGVTRWHRMNPRPKDLCEREPTSGWIWSETIGLGLTFVKDSPLTPSLIEVAEDLYLSWTLVRAIVRSHRFGNDRKLGPSVTTLDSVMASDNPYSSIGSSCIDEWNGAITGDGLILKTRRLWPLSHKAVKQLRSDDDLYRELETGDSVPLSPFMGCTHEKFHRTLCRIVRCRLKHTFRDLSAFADVLRKIRAKSNFCRCQQVFRCPECYSEVVVDITLRNSEDVGVRRMWGDDDSFSEYGLAVTRWSFVGNGVVPCFPPISQIRCTRGADGRDFRCRPFGWEDVPLMAHYHPQVYKRSRRRHTLIPLNMSVSTQRTFT
ncbi:MAG: hypothetical protein M1831_001646 [Alyxoria varia]|nr:MAG: hypothetical protein M1831_001646 [Alyxoria varia]